MLVPLPFIWPIFRDEDDYVITPDGRKVAYDNYIERYQAQSDADRAYADDLMAANPTFGQRMAEEAAPKWQAAREWSRKNQRELPPMPTADRVAWLQERVQKLDALKSNPRIPAYEHAKIDRWIAEAENELTEMETAV